MKAREFAGNFSMKNREWLSISIRFETARIPCTEFSTPALWERILCLVSLDSFVNCGDGGFCGKLHYGI